MHQWKNEQNVVATKVHDTIINNTAIISIDKDLPQIGGKVTTIYTFYGNGVIDVNIDYKPGENNTCNKMIRFGSQMTVAPGFEKLAWYGRGPLPTYIDRNAEMVRLVKSTVNEQWVDYSRPQENGYKTGTVMWPIRTALSGVMATPGGATALAEILGKVETLKRIKAGIETLQAA